MTTEAQRKEQTFQEHAREAERKRALTPKPRRVWAQSAWGKWGWVTVPAN